MICMGKYTDEQIINYLEGLDPHEVVDLLNLSTIDIIEFSIDFVIDNKYKIITRMEEDEYTNNE